MAAEGEYCDWVELKNTSEEPVLLAEYYLTDRKKESPTRIEPGAHLFQLPDEILEPGGLTVLYCSDDKEDPYYTGFGLDSSYDELYLFHGETLVDQLELSGIPVNGSYGRSADTGAPVYFTTATPREENGTGFSRVSKEPEVNIPQSVFAPGTELTVQLTGSGTVYYTLDGTVPTVESTVYEHPLNITETTVLRAICREDGAAPSKVATFSYIIDTVTLPVLSLVVDEYRDFVNLYNNINVNSLQLKQTEFPSTITFFDGDREFTMPCGLRMRGYTSLNMGKKSMAVYFRDRYGNDTLRYDVFGNGIGKYSSLCIRAGQDYNFAYVRNEVMQELCLDMNANVAAQESRYSVLYVNGKYWGMFCLKEDFSSQYYASHYGVKKSSVERENAPFGHNSRFYQDVFAYSLNHKVSTEEGYAYISGVLDIDSLIDWVILEGVSGNTDTVHNCAVFRSDELDGKWRLAFYDLDWCLTYEGFDFRNILCAEGNASWDMMNLMKGLLKNETFRERFLTRFAEVNRTTLSTESILAKIDELTEEIRVEATRDTTRWTQHSPTSWLKHVENMKNLITRCNWSEHNRETLCYLIDGARTFFAEQGFD